MWTKLVTGGVLAVGVTAFLAGVFESSFRHYRDRYGESEDFTAREIRKVIVIEDDEKMSRGKKS